METLETITKETCIKQVEALRSTYLTESQEHCRICNQHCEYYKPVEKTQTPFRQGVNAIYNFWYQNISIKSLPTEKE